MKFLKIALLGALSTCAPAAVPAEVTVVVEVFCTTSDAAEIWAKAVMNNDSTQMKDALENHACFLSDRVYNHKFRAASIPVRWLTDTAYIIAVRAPDGRIVFTYLKVKDAV